MAPRRDIAVIGLGYVGLPVAVAFARSGVSVIGFDIDRARIEELRAGFDRTHEVDKTQLAQPTLVYTCEPEALARANFFIVTVPTPIDASRRPDLTAVLRAAETLGRFLKRGDIVVFESTLYPGAVEEECAPVLETASGLRCGQDFTLGYSPERINPGDKEHRFETITKVVAGQDDKTLQIVAETYGTASAVRARGLAAGGEALEGGRWIGARREMAARSREVSQFDRTVATVIEGNRRQRD